MSRECIFDCKYDRDGKGKLCCLDCNRFEFCKYSCETKCPYEECTLNPDNYKKFLKSLELVVRKKENEYENNKRLD